MNFKVWKHPATVLLVILLFSIVSPIRAAPPYQDDAEALVQQANEQMLMSNFTEAEALYASALELDSKFASAYAHACASALAFGSPGNVCFIVFLVSCLFSGFVAFLLFGK